MSEVAVDVHATKSNPSDSVACTSDDKVMTSPSSAPPLPATAPPTSSSPSLDSNVLVLSYEDSDADMVDVSHVLTQSEAGEFHSFPKLFLFF